MSAPERSNEPREPRRSREHATLKPGGFGDFSVVDRACWATNHPNMHAGRPATTESQPTALSARAEAGARVRSRRVQRRYAQAIRRPRATVTNAMEPLESLQAKLGARAESRVSSDAWAAHEAVLDRLAGNLRVARSYGWRSCAVERVDGATRFGAWGVPPGNCERHPIPDWSTEP